MLCLEGPPGTGKSVLTSKVVDYFRDGLKRPPHEALVFFYCNRAESLHHDSASILRSFVRQLSSREVDKDKTSLRTQTVAYYREAKVQSKQSMDEDRCSQELLDSVNMFPATTIVLDAFDECDEDSRKELEDIFEGLMKDSKRPVKIFISSRPNEVQNLQCSRISIEQKDNRQDIKKFVNAKIDEKHAPKIVRLMKGEITNILLSRSESMFRWVELQLKQLFRCSSKESVYSRLENLPTTLSKLYDEIYEEIQALDEPGRRRAESAIMWVICAGRPLGVDELLDIICIDTDDNEAWLTSKLGEEDVLSLCNDFLVIDRERRVWGFPHLSVLEYFEKQPMESARPNRQRSEVYVANACLQFLNHVTWDSKGSQDVSQLDMTTLADSDRPSLSSAFSADDSLMDYICGYWPTHIALLEKHHPSTPPPSIVRRLKSFLGLPHASSSLYRNWHQVITTKPFYRPEGLNLFMQELLDPATHSIFAMARLGFFYLLQDWWDDLDGEIWATNDTGDNLLTLAAMSGSVPLCRYLLTRGLEVDTVAGEYGSALAAAVTCAHLPVIKFLVEEGHATIDLALSRGGWGSALATASVYAPLEIVQYLLRNKREAVNQVLIHGNHGSALAAAAARNRYEVAKVLLDAGADVNCTLEHRVFGSALAAAAFAESTEIAELFVKRGANINMPLERGLYGSALAAAAIRPGGVQIVRLLVDNGADVNQVLISGVYFSALLASLCYKRMENFLYLVSHGANISSILTSDCSVPKLARALCYDHRELLDDLLDDNADINRVIQEGVLIRRLMEALDAWDDRRHVAEALIKVGTDVNATLWHRWFGSCLEAVAFRREVEQARFLVNECNANVNLVTRRGVFGSALAAAAAGNSLDVLEFLLEKGANPNQRPRDGVLGTPLMMAAFAGRFDCAKALLDAGADASFYVENGTFHDALEATTAPIIDSEDIDSEDEEESWWNLEERSTQKIKEDRDKVMSLLRNSRSDGIRTTAEDNHGG